MNRMIKKSMIIMVVLFTKIYVNMEIKNWDKLLRAGPPLTKTFLVSSECITNVSVNDRLITLILKTSL